MYSLPEGECFAKRGFWGHPKKVANGQLSPVWVKDGFVSQTLTHPCWGRLLRISDIPFCGMYFYNEKWPQPLHRKYSLER